MHFSRQLSVFVEAGIPIMQALEVISEETTDKLLKKVLLDMIVQIQAGETFVGRCVPSRGLSPLLRRGSRVRRADRERSTKSSRNSRSIFRETSTLGHSSFRR